jgi:protein-S-isoprenylcysteine O-methyltransferase Ste14
MAQRGLDPQAAGVGVLVRRVTLAVAAWLGVLCLLLFSAAGRWDWPRGWAFVAVVLVTVVVNVPVLIRANPELLRQRLKRHKGTKPFDKVCLAMYAVAGVALFLVAGLDSGRFAWWPLDLGVFLPGLVLHVAGDAAVLWAMAVNPHLEPTVRIQEERDHKVVTAGPYRIVRHPAYVGIISMIAGAPLILGSGWAYVPAGAAVLVLVLRTALEDRTLRKELAGYEDYCRRTRYRMIPGVW